MTNKEKISWALGYLFVALLLSIIYCDDFIRADDLLMGSTGITIGYFLKKDKSMAPMFISAVTCIPRGTLLIYAASVLVFDVNTNRKIDGHG